MYTSLSNFLYIQELISELTLKVSKFQKKIFLFLFEPKNEQNNPFLTYCLIWPNSIRAINGKEYFKLLILDTFGSVESEEQKILN